MSAFNVAVVAFCVFVVAMLPAILASRSVARYQREEIERTNAFGVVMFESAAEARRFDARLAAAHGMVQFFGKVAGIVGAPALLTFVAATYRAIT